MTRAAALRPRPPSPALGGPLVHLSVTGSTNDRAREAARAGAPGGTVVVAEEQTAGRGRQGRSWVAPPGLALTLSIVIRPGAGADPGSLALLPLAMPLAVCECCEQTEGIACAIKWPNDVWAGGRKLAGILIESRPQDGWAVAGIGLNVNTAESDLPAEPRGTATSLRIESGRHVDRERVLDALLERVAAWAAAAEGGRRDDLLAAYRERDLLRGRKIRWSAGERTLTGEAQGIDESGNLVVFTEAGERLVFDAGEIHLLPD